jgi:hypothetical protein
MPQELLDNINPDDLDSEIAALEADLGYDVDLDVLLGDENVEEVPQATDPELEKVDEKPAVKKAPVKAKATETKPRKKKAEAKKEAKTPRVTLVGHKPSEVLSARILDSRLFELHVSDESLPEDELIARRQHFLKIADEAKVKPSQKIVNLFLALQEGAKLNIYTKICFKHLIESKEPVSSKSIFDYLKDAKANGVKAYGDSTARAISSQYFNLMKDLGLAKESEGGKSIVYNTDSALGKKLKKLIAA